MAGGVALNCVANGRILARRTLRGAVRPARGVGRRRRARRRGDCASAADRRARRRRSRSRTCFSGPRIRASEIRALLAGSQVQVCRSLSDDAALVDHVAERLARGEVVGWFRGAMEFGPRALGARSILADPRNPAMRDRVNAFVKKREALPPLRAGGARRARARAFRPRSPGAVHARNLPGSIAAGSAGDHARRRLGAPADR